MKAPAAPGLAREALGAGLAAFAITVLIEAGTRGALVLVVHPLHLASLAAAAPLAAVSLQRLRGLPALHRLALVTATFALQLALMLAWGAGASWMLATRG